MEVKTCSICKLEVSQKFCGNCGQKIGKTETTLLSIVSDFFSNFLSVEKSVFACIYKIFVDPKSIVENYWKGNRKYYPSPGKMFFYSLAIAALHLTYVSTAIMGMDLMGTANHGQFEFGTQFMFWLIFLPLLILSSHLTYFKKKFSFTKHLISIIYLASSFFMVIVVLQDVIEYFFPASIEGISFLIFAFMIFIWNSIVFSPAENKSKIALNTLLSIVIFFLLASVLFGILYLFIPIQFN